MRPTALLARLATLTILAGLAGGCSDDAQPSPDTGPDVTEDAGDDLTEDAGADVPEGDGGVTPDAAGVDAPGGDAEADAAPDTGPDIVITGCKADADCGAFKCDVATGLCVECHGDADCDDGSPCTSDTCAAGNCAHEPVGGEVACSDGNPCTLGDTCIAGACQGTMDPACCAPLDCPKDAVANDADGDGCVDTCVCADGTVLKPGAACPNCVADADCDDGKTCTDDLCIGNVCENMQIAPCCDTTCDCYVKSEPLKGTCFEPCSGCGNHWACEDGMCIPQCGELPPATVDCAFGCKAVSCEPPLVAFDGDGDGCAEQCVCAPGMVTEGDGCACDPGFGCANGALSVDTDGNGCPDTCTGACANACECYDSGATAGASCAPLKPGAGKFWACEGGTCVEQCGPLPVELETCPAASCMASSDCLVGDYCVKAPGTCGEAGTCAPRPEGCLPIEDPVCGCDGTTYGNACAAAEAGVAIEKAGPCEPVAAFCNTEDNGQCFKGFFCNFVLGTCKENLAEGACLEVPTGCPKVIEPVCGCDGSTYDNDCTAAMAKVSILHYGACGDPVPKK